MSDLSLFRHFNPTQIESVISLYLICLHKQHTQRGTFGHIIGKKNIFSISSANHNKSQCYVKKIVWTILLSDLLVLIYLTTRNIYILKTIEKNKVTWQIGFITVRCCHVFTATSFFMSTDKLTFSIHVEGCSYVCIYRKKGKFPSNIKSYFSCKIKTKRVKWLVKY